ncbi:MAG TPA: hypothetical protein VFC54_09320 [Pseudolabrys sp.]|nr:hypothetical protein [Pseudolabrys sp.]
MAHKIYSIVLVALSAIAASAQACAQSRDDPYTIMRPEPGEKPEPWLAPKYKSPRGTREHVVHPRAAAPPPQVRAQTPPSIYVPETGRVLPNMAMPGAGPGGAETGQDRALRCAHQAGAYGAAAGDRNSYIGSCINQ